MAFHSTTATCSTCCRSCPRRRWTAWLPIRPTGSVSLRTAGITTFPASPIGRPLPVCASRGLCCWRSAALELTTAWPVRSKMLDGTFETASCGFTGRDFRNRWTSRRQSTRRRVPNEKSSENLDPSTASNAATPKSTPPRRKTAALERPARLAWASPSRLQPRRMPRFGTAGARH